MGPRVTIITVCLNSASTLEQTIRSVLSQSYDTIEYLIVDGGSTDGTLEIIKRYEDKLAGWTSEPDRGLYDAMNKGIARASGELVGIVNADDYLEPGAVARVVEECRKHPEADIFHGQLRMVDPKSGTNYIAQRSQDIMRRRFKQLPALHPTCFVTRRCYEQEKGFDIAYRYAADVEFLLRCIHHGFKFQYIPQVLSNMRSGGLSTRRFIASFKEARRARIAHGCGRALATWYYLRSCFLFYLVHRLMPALGIRSLYEWHKNRKHKTTGPSQSKGTQA